MKRRIRILLGLLALLVVVKLPAQAPADTLQRALQLALKARFATSDNLGNIYLINDQNALEKYGPDGRLIARYTNNRLGQACGLDATNPLKVLAWYADFRTVIFLDRTLTMLGELNLIQGGFPEVRTVAAAADGNIWLYDEGAFQLKKISPDGALLFESQALSQIQPARIAVQNIRDNGAEVLACDTSLGVFCFDVYGQFLRLIPLKGMHSFILIQNYLLYHTAGRLHIQDLQGFYTHQMPLPPVARQAGAQIWLAPGRLLVQSSGGPLEVWTY
ncbi:MAG: hypothetical protein IPH12_21060 [Saprospirales bacterium]|nr:hypothetical protein [Saprospirales bacterium]